jgi:hypothetical protein
MSPIIFIIGLVGNILGFIVLLRKNLIKIGPREMYRFLFIMDIIILQTLTVTYLSSALNLNILIISKVACKLFGYLSLWTGSITPYILIYISVDKIIATKYPTRKYFLRKTETQIIYFLIITSYSSVYYLETLFIFDVIQLPISNSTTLSVCFTSNYELFHIGILMDILNRVLIPTILMFLTSIIFLNSIWKLNQRIAQNFGTNKNLRKQISRIVSLLILNIFFIFSSLPISIVGFFYTNLDIEFSACYYFRFIAYSINFYVFLFTNSLFRKEFLSLVFKN